MANDRKIEPNTPNLLVKYRELVRLAAEKGAHEAIAKHKLAGNPIAVGRNGSVVLLQPGQIPDFYSSVGGIWLDDANDVSLELLES